MANTGLEPASSKGYPIGGLVDSCNWIWKRVVPFFWITILLVLILGIFVNWATDFHKVPDILVWMYMHLQLVIIIGISLIFFTTLMYVVRFLPVDTSERAMKRKYLSCLADGNVLLGLAGIPTGLVMKTIALEKVFIRPLFHYAPATNVQVPDEAELEPYRYFREQGIRIQENTDILNEARREQEARSGTAIAITELWQRLTKDSPAVVIQGYPGIGKSTLLNRLTLCMARRMQGKPDPDSVLSSLTPTMIPLFIVIKEYADWREQHPVLSDEQRSVLSFLQHSITKVFEPPDDSIVPFIKKWLDDGTCLVLFDGLDEVSDEQERTRIQKAIKSFIQKQSHPDRQGNSYNRFIISTRIAGYDRDAFPYPNYLIAELEEEQIAEFLPRWCRASINAEELGLSQEGAVREAARVTNSILDAMNANPGVQRLTKIPLLLTLMAAMKQRGIDLPRNRAELYKKVTETLLEKRNEAKGIQPLSVAQAVQRLGPLAFEMNKSENQFATEPMVLAALQAAIRSPQGGGANLSTEQVQHEAHTYLRRISERGGLFVKRLSDYYGFFHRTFEEYFAARYILDTIELATDREQELMDFITLVRQDDDLWREPYLLAVAHKSEEISSVANDLISRLLHTPADASREEKLHDLLLATTAVIESKENTIDRDLQYELATTLLQNYRDAFHSKRFDDCDKIEDIVQQWLLSLTEKSYQPLLLKALREAVFDRAHPDEQRSVLTMLAIIIQPLVTASNKEIFDTLIPPLLALAGLPAVVEGDAAFTPTDGLAASDDPTVRDLALTVLSLMGKRGPGGRLLPLMKEQFKEYLPLLARYSLDCGTLITPFSIPLSYDNYQRYEAAIARWIDLREKAAKNTHTTNADREKCLDIHKTLLQAAEDVNYPTASTMLAMLDASSTANDSWQEIWHQYLLDQLETGASILYFDTALLYNSLFIKRKEQASLATLVERQYTYPSPRQQLATRFIAYMSEDFSNFDNLHYFRSFQHLRYLRYFRNSTVTYTLKDLQTLQGPQSFQDSKTLRYCFLTKKFAQIAMHRLKELELQPDLLQILLGRIIQMQEMENIGKEFEEEVQLIIQTVTPYLTSTAPDLHYAALNVLRYIPTRTENEIRFVVMGAEQTEDKQVRDAYCSALQKAQPIGESEEQMIKEIGKLSPVAEVRMAVERNLELDMDLTEE